MQRPVGAPALGVAGLALAVPALGESRINPSAAIDPGRGTEAPDGPSRMPGFNEDLTVQELEDLVVSTLNRKPPAAAGPAAPAAGGHGEHGR